jgi:pimeloyl-ACP methyl ester carboxylesterase
VRSETLVAGPAGQLAVADLGGSGPDLLLLHGANRTLCDWTPIVALLGDVHCVAYDLRGHGRSDPPADGDYSFDAHLADLDAVVHAVGLERPIIIGHSLGGDIALMHAAREPGCRGIVDIEGFGGAHSRQYPDYDPAEVRARRRAQAEAVIAMLGDERLTAEQAQTVVDRARAVAPLVNVSAEFEERAARRALVPDGSGGFLRRPSPAAQTAIAAPLEEWDPFELLGTTGVPTLAIHGTRRPAELAAMPDDVRGFIVAVMETIDADLRAADQRNPHVEVAVLSDAGHMVQLESPEAAARRIAAFVASVASPGRSACGPPE